jgi:hypothetical protein
VFCEKRLQAIENKGQELQKERQESSRARKLMKGRHLDLDLCETVAVESGKGHAAFAEVRQGKELAGLAGISWDIIPFG